MTTPFPRLMLILAGLASISSAEDISALRSSLLAELTARAATDTRHEPGTDVHLVLEEAIRYHGTKVRYTSEQSGIVWETAELSLSKRGGAWIVQGVGGFSVGLSDRFVLHGVDTQGLTCADGRLGGSLGLSSSRYRHREDMHGTVVFHHLPPEEMPVPDWSLGGEYRTRPYAQTFRLDFAADAGEAWLLELDLAQAVRQEMRPASDAELQVEAAEAVKAKASKLEKSGHTMPADERERFLATTLAELKAARDRGSKDTGIRRISASVRMDAEGRFHSGYAKGWNKAGHDVATRLAVGENGMSGELELRLRPDRWMLQDHPVQVFTFTVVKPDSLGRIRGTCTASGHYGTYPCDFTGTLRQARVGRYAVQGPDGDRAGTALAAILPAPGIDAPPAPADAQEAHRQVRALLTARDAYPRPISDCFAEATPNAEAPTDATALATGLDWLAGSALRSAAAPAPARGATLSADPDFGPWYGGCTTVADAAGVCVLPPPRPDAVQAWAAPAAWRWFGPVAGRPISPEPWASLPPVAGWRPAGCTAEWTPLDAPAQGYFLPAPLADAVQQSALKSFHWYAVTRIATAEPRELWLALPAHQDGMLWLDGVPIWQGTEGADSLQTAVVRVPLAAGEHELLLRAGLDGLTWSGSMGSVVVTGADKLRHAAMGVLLATAGAPRAQPGSRTSIEVLANGRHAGTPGTPPLAWSLAGNTNVRWSLSTSAALRQPVLLGDGLLLVDGGTLRLIDLRSGQERWRLATGLGSLAHPVVVKDAALVHGGDGTVLGVGSDGRERWRVATDAVWQERSMATGLMHSAKEVPQPAVLPDGVVLTLPTTLDEPSIDRKGQPALVKKPVARWICLDAASGAERWRRTEPGSGVDLTTLRLRREGLERVLLASADGILIDATDGTVLRRELSGMADAGLRIGADGDALYLVSAAGDQWIGGWISGFKASCQVWLDEHGRVGQRFRWRAKGPSRYDGPPPLLSRGRMLFPRCNSGHHQEGPAPYSKLHVVDAVSGTLLGDVNPLLDQGTAPIDLALVADRLYVADAGGAQPFNSNKLARIAVLTNDDIPLVIAENLVPVGRLKPIFAEQALIVAGEGQVHCLAVDSEAGRRWQYEQVAQTLVARLGTQPTDPGERLVEVSPLTYQPDRSRIPVVPFRHRTLPDRMLLLGPLPQSIPEERWLHHATASTAADVPSLGTVLDLGDTRHAFAYPPAGVLRYAGPNWSPLGNDWLYAASWQLDCWAAVQRQERSVSLLTAVVEVSSPMSWRHVIEGNGVRVWMGGQELRHGDLVELRPGLYPYAIALSIGKVPAFLRERTIIAGSGFVRYPAMAERRAQWRGKLQRHRAIIEETRIAIPGSALAGQLTAMVEEADRPVGQ